MTSVSKRLWINLSGYSASLPWSTRMKIAHGAATGLQFLHEAENPVIYRDFKASNILLDSVSNKKSNPIFTLKVSTVKVFTVKFLTAKAFTTEINSRYQSALIFQFIIPKVLKKLLYQILFSGLHGETL